MITANHEGTKNFETSLQSALKYISEHYKEVLFPLDTLKISPDIYIAIIKILLPFKLLSQNEAQRILSFVIRNQRKDGSWPEILAWRPAEERSVVSTAITGFQLFDLTEAFEDFREESWNRLQIAGDFVVCQEVEDGWFRKSKNISLDTINVNVLSSLFLVKCYNAFDRSEYFAASLRGIKRAIKSQKTNGEFLYYTTVPRIASLFYHAITANCLAEFYQGYPYDEALKSAIKAGLWMVAKQNQQGRFSWRGCVDHWSYKNFSTYAFALETFAFLSQFADLFAKAYKKTLSYISSSQANDGSFPVKDAAVSTNALSEDFRNALSLIGVVPTQFPLSFFRSTRMVFYNANGPLQASIYQLLNGGRSYVEDKLVFTVETVDRLMRARAASSIS